MFFKSRKRKKFLKVLKEGNNKKYTEKHLMDALVGGETEKANEILEHLIHQRANKIYK